MALSPNLYFPHLSIGYSCPSAVCQSADCPLPIAASSSSLFSVFSSAIQSFLPIANCRLLPAFHLVFFI